MHTYSEDKEVLMKLLNISKTDIDNIFQKNDRDSME